MSGYGIFVLVLHHYQEALELVGTNIVAGDGAGPDDYAGPQSPSTIRP